MYISNDETLACFCCCLYWETITTHKMANKIQYCFSKSCLLEIISEQRPGKTRLEHTMTLGCIKYQFCETWANLLNYKKTNAW